MRINVAATDRVATSRALHLYRATRPEAIAFFTRPRVDTTSRVLFGFSSVRLGSIRLLSARLDFESRRHGHDDDEDVDGRAIDRSGFREIIITPVEIYLATRGTWYFLKSAVYARQREPRSREKHARADIQSWPSTASGFSRSPLRAPLSLKCQLIILRQNLRTDVTRCRGIRPCELFKTIIYLSKRMLASASYICARG